MKFWRVVITLLALANTDFVSPEEEFQTWKKKFGKIYMSVTEESQHKNAWMENYELVRKHNKLAEQGVKSYKLGMNYFADMRNQEYTESLLKGCLLYFNVTRNHREVTYLQQKGRSALPETVNWKDKGYVTNVTDQMDCNSCWAFSATGALEGQVFKKTGKLVQLSKQQLIDCSHEHGNRGCKGGRMQWAFEYVKNQGLNTEDSYPYEAKGGTCRLSSSTVGATCNGYVDIKSTDENALQEAVATIGPISASIQAERNTFQLYDSGVYDEPECSCTSLDHGVLVVGYGTDNGNDYWLVKNSWGIDWGENGYIKMSRNKDNQCGIATAASYPLVSNKTQHVQCEACSMIFVLGFVLVSMFY